MSDYYGDQFDAFESQTDAEIKKASLDVILQSKAFTDPLHPKHNVAMREWFSLNGMETPKKYQERPGALGEDKQSQLDDLAKNPAFLDRLHPDHKDTVRRFIDLHKPENE